MKTFITEINRVVVWLQVLVKNLASSPDPPSRP